MIPQPDRRAAGTELPFGSGRRSTPAVNAISHIGKFSLTFFLTDDLLSFMDIEAATSDLPPQPGPTAEARPRRFAPLLSLVRRMIDYGRQLAASLQNPTATTDLDHVAETFGSYDFSRIIASILRGLHRAGLLQARLTRLDARPDPEPNPIGSGPSRPHGGAPYAPHTPRGNQPPPDLIRMPTPEQIAKQVRSNSIGVILADVCRELGITHEHPLWRELFMAIMQYDGSIARLDRDISLRPWLDRATRQPITSGVPLFCRPSLLATTGPPLCSSA
jgi:hypothetical protein